MARHIFQGTFTDGNGRVVSATTTTNGIAGLVSVYLAGTTTAANVYEASSGGSHVNSVNTDDDGKFLFYVDDGEYSPRQKFKVTLSHANFQSKTFDNLEIIPAWAYDYYADAAATDQGAATSDGDKSLKDLIDSIGSESARIILTNSGPGNTTTYTLTTSETIPSNVRLIIRDGAILDGAGTLTINGSFEGSIGCFGSSITLAGTPKIDAVYPEWFGAAGDGSTDDTASIESAITFATAQGTVDNQSVFFNDAKDVKFGPFEYIISSQITVPSHVNIVGSGTKNTVFTTSGTDAGFIFQSYGGCSRDFTIHGSNTVTTQLFYADVTVQRTFANINIEWSLGDGAVLDNCQNCTFSQFNISSCGDTDTPSGALLKFVDTSAGSSSNLFLRCEFSSPAAYGIYYLETKGATFIKNLFVDCLIEYWKGKWTGAYYGSAISSTVLAMVYFDGGDYGHPALEFYDSNITKYGHDTAASVIDIRNGATITLHNTQVQGDASYLAVGIKITSGTLTTYVYIQDFSYSVYGCSAAFDTYGTNFYIESYGKSYFGNNTAEFSNDSGLSYEDRVALDTHARLTLNSGQIYFPTTQNASTATSVLDDYFEGSFSPQLYCNGTTNGVTMTTQYGSYTKIGDAVLIQIDLTCSLSSPDSGDVTIGDLPSFSFWTGQTFSFSVGDFSGLSDGTVLTSTVDDTGVVNLYSPIIGGSTLHAGDYPLDSSDLGASFSIKLSGFLKVLGR